MMANTQAEEETPKDNTLPNVGARYRNVLKKLRDPLITRRAILADLKALAHEHPKTEQAHLARRDVALLTLMVREDEQHARVRTRDRPLSRQQQIADWIFHLRDQTATVWCSGKRELWADIFDPSDGPTPAHRLAAFGYDAVPALLDILEDERFTRSVCGDCPLRVGICALIVLEEIANQPFRNISSTFEIDQTSAGRKKARVWWKEAQKKGEKLMLIEGTERGDDRSPKDARRLIERYPEIALNAVTTGVRRSQDGHVRSALLRAADNLRDLRVIDLFRQELNGGDWQTRLLAAQLLCGRGREGGVKAMIREWQTLGNEADDRQVESILGFLASSGKAEALTALTANSPKRSVELRVQVIEALRLAREKPDVGGEARNLIDQFLVECLDDKQPCAAHIQGPNRNLAPKLRICDEAATILARVWTPAFSFNVLDGVAVRDRQIVGLKNYWRLKQNMRPLLR
jgi:hypothetical protein